MQNILFFVGLFLVVQNGLSAQCLSQPVCPIAPQTFCDSTQNNAFYWNNAAFPDPNAESHDLGETGTDLSMQIVASCGTDSVHVSFILLLDLDGDGFQETAVASAALPGTAIIYYGNAANPNYTGGEARYFDTRPVPTNEKYEFVLEKTEEDSLVTVRVRWANALLPNDYVLPELPGGTHRIEWRFEQDGEVKTCGYDFVVYATNNINACATNYCNGEGIEDVALKIDVSGHPAVPPFTYFELSNDAGCNSFSNPMRFSQANDYYGFQFGLQFDPAQIEILEVIPETGTADNFGVFSDHVNGSWSYPLPRLFLPDEPIFRLRIKALAPLHLADVFSLATDALHAEAYPTNDSLVRLRLQFGTVATTEPDEAQIIFAPVPNPTTAGVRIPLRLEQSATVGVELLDATGRRLYQQEQRMGAGAQWIDLPTTAFPQAGVYLWRVKAGVAAGSGKIVRQ